MKKAKLKQRKYSEELKREEGAISIMKIMGTGIDEDHRIILDREKLKWIIGVLKREGLKVVYTSGVYDLLHEGHVRYLERAKALGDVLIVGVDSDELTRRRKPREKVRPIDNINVRLAVLARNRSVNILTVRDVHEELEQLVRDILPDVAVFSKGTKDTKHFEKDIRRLLSDYCGKIVFLKPLSTNSTTAKIRNLALNGANDLALFIRDRLNYQLADKDFKKIESTLQEFFDELDHLKK